MFFVRSVYFNLRNILPKSGKFLPGHLYIYIYIYIYIYVYMYARRGQLIVVHFLKNAMRVKRDKLTLIVINRCENCLLFVHYR